MKTGRVLLAALAALCGPSVVPAEEPDEPPVATAALEEVFADAVPWLGREFRAAFQVQSLPETWNPYLTRFGPRDYTAVRIWGDGQFLWEAEAWDNPLGLVFARRGSAAEELLADAAPYARFEAQLRVRQVFLGQAWAEIVALRPLRRQVGEGTILHAGRALQLMNGDSWKLALEDLHRAAIPSLPRHALDELERLSKICQEQVSTRAARRIPVPPTRSK
jgi:hypothetical protein